MLRILSTQDYESWFSEQNVKIKAQVQSRLSRIIESNHYGDVKRIDSSIAELRWKNGLRIYFSYTVDAKGSTMKSFKEKSLKPIKISKTTKLFRVEPRDFFQNHKEVVASLSLALIEGDKEAFQEIISSYLSIINKEELSRLSKVPIATIRRMAAGSNYNIETLLKITNAINKAA